MIILPLCLTLCGALAPQEPGTPPPPPEGREALPPKGEGAPCREDRPHAPAPRPGMHPGRGPRPFELPDLSEPQRKALRELEARHRKALEALQRAAREKTETLREAMEDPELPEATLRKLHGEASEAHLQEMLAQHALSREALGILTEAQRAKAKRIREARRTLARELGPVPPPEAQGPRTAPPERR